MGMVVLLQNYYAMNMIFFLIAEGVGIVFVEGVRYIPTNKFSPFHPKGQLAT